MGIKMKQRRNKDTIEDWKFTNMNWKGVLKEIVNYAPNRYGRGKNNYGQDHPLVKKLKVKPHELGLIMSFLEDQGLIEYQKPEYNWVNLTSKGFDVALQNQSQQIAFRTSFVIVQLTAIIAFTAVVSLINADLTWEARIGLIAFIAGLGYIWLKVSRRRI